MELTKIKHPHVVEKAYALFSGNNLTLFEIMYLLMEKWIFTKTSRYRITQWGEDGNLGYELYDHKLDENELNNLAERIQNSFRLLKNCFKAKNS